MRAVLKAVLLILFVIAYCGCSSVAPSQQRTTRAYEVRTYVIITGFGKTIMYDILVPVDSLPDGRIINMDDITSPKEKPKTDDKTV